MTYLQCCQLSLIVRQICDFIYRVEQKLHDLLERKSSTSSGMLSPRASTWSPFERGKLKVKTLEKLRDELTEALKHLEIENKELKDIIKNLKKDKEEIKEKLQDSRESFELYKNSMIAQEDPFVLRLALNQSRKDYTKVVKEV